MRHPKISSLLSRWNQKRAVLINPVWCRHPSKPPAFSAPDLKYSPLSNILRVAQATLLTALLMLTFGQSVAAAAIKHNELITQYDQAISNLELSLGAAKAHRTALIERMDTLGKDLKNIETAAIKTNVKNPSLHSELQQLQLDLAQIEKQLKLKKIELEQQQALSGRLPVPGVLADALADSSALEQHRDLALWQYRIHLKKKNIEAVSNRKGVLLNAIDANNNRKTTLRNSIQKLTDHQKSLANDRKSLEAKFASLSADIVRQQDRIERMTTRRRVLLDDPKDSVKFNRFRGVLPDPTRGTLFKRYAEPKAEGLLQWEGILVKAPLGQEIEAVFDGTVVFAAEIQGLGNVAIVDHGADFMTLYGMAELLVVEEEQTVIAGQVIGTVGESVGDDASALYFEVRHNAAPVNPEDWLSMQLISSDPAE